MCLQSRLLSCSSVILRSKKSAYSLSKLVLIFSILSQVSCTITPNTQVEKENDAASSHPIRTNISLNIRPKASLDLVLIHPTQPIATLVLMPGGPGKVGISGINIANRIDFVTLTAEMFVAQQIAIAVIDTPSDHPDGLTPRYRQTKTHEAELTTIVERLKKETGLPIWVLGISRSTLSAMHAAINIEDDISGLVLLSSITNIPTGSGATNLTNLNLDQVSIPTLVIAHKKDSCQGTPPRGATEILGSLKKSPNAMVKFFQGGFESGYNPCLPGTYHTFNGIQDKVAKLIAEFIKNNIKSDNHSD